MFHPCCTTHIKGMKVHPITHVIHIRCESICNWAYACLLYCILHSHKVRRYMDSYYSLGAYEGLKIALALLGKMAVSGSFAVLYMYSAELFPTEVRYVWVMLCAHTLLWPHIYLLGHLVWVLPVWPLELEGYLLLSYFSWWVVQCVQDTSVRWPLPVLQPTSHAMVVLSALGLVAGFLTLSLPETLGQPLPETLADLERRTVPV